MGILNPPFVQRHWKRAVAEIAIPAAIYAAASQIGPSPETMTLPLYVTARLALALRELGNKNQHHLAGICWIVFAGSLIATALTAASIGFQQRQAQNDALNTAGYNVAVKILAGEKNFSDCTDYSEPQDFSWEFPRVAACVSMRAESELKQGCTTISVLEPAEEQKGLCEDSASRPPGFSNAWTPATFLEKKAFE